MHILTTYRWRYANILVYTFIFLLVHVNMMSLLGKNMCQDGFVLEAHHSYFFAIFLLICKEILSPRVI